MKHLNLFGFLLIALSITTAQFNPLQAQIKNVTIGKVSDKNITYPIKESTTNAITEIIYTRDELKDAGAIESITFHYNNASDYELHNFVVWIVPYYEPEIIKDKYIYEELIPIFAERAFMIPAGKGELTIPFKEPYFYNGKGNLSIIIAHENTPAKENPKFVYFETKGQNMSRINYDLNDMDYPCKDAKSILSNKRPLTTIAIDYNAKAPKRPKSDIQEIMRR